MTFQKKFELLFEELSFKIIRCCFEVHKELGGGHLEIVYQKALAKSFQKAELKFVEQKNLTVEFLSSQISTYRPDFIVEEKIDVELKRTNRILPEDFDQVTRYLKLTELQLGLIVHFGKEKVTIKRVVNFKEPSTHT